MDTETLENEDVDLDLEQDTQTDDTSTQTQPGKPGAAPAATPGTTTDDLKSALAELAGHVKSVTTPKEAPRQLSEAERAKYWGVWNPTEKNPEWYDQFLGFDETTDPKTKERKLLLFKEMHEGLVRQAMVGAMNLARQELAQYKEQLEAEYGDIREFVSTERAEKTRNRFFSSYPALNDPRYSKVIDGVARMIADENFNNETEYFKVLAERTAEQIKGLIPDFELGAVQTKKPTAGTTPRLPRTSVGGTGGAGGGQSRGGQSGPRDDSDGLFDD